MPSTPSARPDVGTAALHPVAPDVVAQGVYAPLGEYLRNLGRESVTLTYQEIENILGRALPGTATKRRQWWENNPTMHPQARAWLDAGMQVTAVRLGEAVTFARRG